MSWAADFMDPASGGKMIIPLKDLQLVLPAILGNQKPPSSSFFASTNRANVHYEVWHAPLSGSTAMFAGGFRLDSGGVRTALVFVFLFKRTGSGTVTNPPSVVNVKVKTDEQSSQSQ